MLNSDSQVDSKDDKKQFDVLLANKWDIESGPDPTGWWASEKLDGVRCVYSRSSTILLVVADVHKELFSTASNSTAELATSSSLRRIS